MVSAKWHEPEILLRVSRIRAASGQVRSFGTATLRVRSLGYTGRDPGMAGTSVVSQKETFEVAKFAARKSGVRPHPTQGRTTLQR